MERFARVFDNWQDAEAADLAYYASLTPEARVQLQLELIARYLATLGDAEQGLARVCRVVEFPRR